MITNLISRCLILVLAILLPAYKSYKSLRGKNQKDIIAWLMYWIVFAIYTAVEMVTDNFFSWFPFYYEGKIAFILWLVLPVTRGYSIIFRKLVHPELQRRETEIDDIIERASEKGYSAILNFGAKGINFAASTVLTTAVRGQEMLASRSLSMGDLTQRFLTQGSMVSPSTEHLDSVFGDLDDAIEGHGDTAPAPITSSRLSSRQRSHQKKAYDCGTFPKRRMHTNPLNEVPEEDLLQLSEEMPETRREKNKVSHTLRQKTSASQLPWSRGLEEGGSSEEESFSADRIRRRYSTRSGTRRKHRP